MAVLDGKYEILTQTALNDHQTQFSAVAPDGRALRVVWYDLSGVNDEQQFERYRKLLRALRGAGLAALHDVVARPGAHYVAWYAPEQARWAKASPDLEAVLGKYAYEPTMADIRLDKDGQPRVFDLAFAPDLSSFQTVPTAAPKPEEPAKMLQPRFPDFRLGAWGLSVLLFGLSLGLSLWGFQLSRNLRTVLVPDLVGQNVNEAARALYDLQLNVEASAVSASRPVGEVLSMSPRAGTFLRPFYRTVRLSYAAPGEQIGQLEVPDLQNVDRLEAASSLLEAAGLALGQHVYTFSSRPSGTVLAQSRSPGSRVGAGDRIDILLSAGPEPSYTLVPDVTGLSREDAQFLVRVAGLRTPVFEEVTSPEPPGTVVEQTIAPLEVVPASSTLLRLYVAGGDSRTDVPALIGLNPQEAEQLASGFDLIISEISTPDLPSGVVAQRPAPGEAAGDSELKLTVNTYAPARAVPRPQVSATYRAPEPRTLSYSWPVGRGVRTSNFEVRVTDPSGESFVVQRGTVSANERVFGEFSGEQVGTYTFELFLNGEPFSIPLERD